jgi:hypothetical protein
VSLVTPVGAKPVQHKTILSITRPGIRHEKRLPAFMQWHHYFRHLWQARAPKLTTLLINLGIYSNCTAETTGTCHYKWPMTAESQAEQGEEQQGGRAGACQFQLRHLSKTFISKTFIFIANSLHAIRGADLLASFARVLSVNHSKRFRRRRRRSFNHAAPPCSRPHGRLVEPRFAELGRTSTEVWMSPGFLKRWLVDLLLTLLRPHALKR